MLMNDLGLTPGPSGALQALGLGTDLMDQVKDTLKVRRDQPTDLIPPGQTNLAMPMSQMLFSKAGDAR